MIEPRRPRFQFTLRTLLLLFVVLGSSLAVIGLAGIPVFAATVFLAISLCGIRPSWRLLHLALTVLCLIGALRLLLPQMIGALREEFYDALCRNNLRQLGLALRKYHATNKCFPPACTTNKSGKPLHSWRALILPNMYYDSIYNGLDFSQPWDSPRNKGVLAYQPQEFVCPSDPSSYVPGTTQTDYFAVVGPNTAWDRSRPLAPSGKEAPHTIMLVEVADSCVAWAEPRDFSLDALAVIDSEREAHPMSSNHHPLGEFFYTDDPVAGGVVALADGSVGFLRTDNLSPDELRKILQIGGYTQEVIDARGSLYVNRRLNWPNIAALAVWLVSVGTLLTAAIRSRTARSAFPTPAANDADLSI